MIALPKRNTGLKLHQNQIHYHLLCTRTRLMHSPIVPDMTCLLSKGNNVPPNGLNMWGPQLNKFAIILCHLTSSRLIWISASAIVTVFVKFLLSRSNDTQMVSKLSKSKSLWGFICLVSFTEAFIIWLKSVKLIFSYE